MLEKQKCSLPVRGIIAAVSPEGVIGVDGKIPWHYSGDLRRFKQLTLNTTVIMGRLTWVSLGQKPLPKRQNVVITQKNLAGVTTYRSIGEALDACTGTVWFIGGARIYEEAMILCDRLDITYVPDSINHPKAVYFPPIDPELWVPGPLRQHPGDAALRLRTYMRRTATPILRPPNDGRRGPQEGTSFVPPDR